MAEQQGVGQHWTLDNILIAGNKKLLSKHLLRSRRLSQELITMAGRHCSTGTWVAQCTAEEMRKKKP